MIAFIFMSILGYIHYKNIKKYELRLYIISVVLSIAIPLININLLDDFAIAFFLVVMYAGAFSRKQEIGKRLRSIRKEYSIIGFIFASCHGIYYIYGDNIELIGLISLIMAIPLTYTSFIFVRKRMSNKLWKRVQKLAYIMYIGMFVHMIVLEEYAYILVFLPYLILKIVYEAKSLKQNILKN